MLVSQAITKAYYEATGKTNLLSANSKYQGLIIACDNAQQDWQNEMGGQWDSLFRQVTVGTLGTANTYDLDDSIRVVSKQERNPLVLQKADKTQSASYSYVTPERLRYYGGGYSYKNMANVFTVYNNDGQRQVQFPSTFSSTDPKLGWSIIVPGFIYVDTITSANQTIQCDDPMYIVYIMAAKYCQGKTSLDYKYDALMAKANERMNSMRQQQSGQITDIPTIGVDNYYSPDSYGSYSQEAWM